MANRSADANLIKAVSDSYINYDNAPGMYKGLDKASRAIKKIGKDYLKDKETKEKELEIRAKATKAKNDKQWADWNEVTADVNATVGSFKSKTDYDWYFDKLESVRLDLFAAQNEEPPNQKGITKAMNTFNNIKADVNDTVDLRADWAAAEKEGIGVSNAMLGTDNPNGGNDGRDLKVVTMWMKEDYEVSEIDVAGGGGGKERVYTFPKESLPEGAKLHYTKKELEKMYIPKDFDPGNKYAEILGNYTSATSVNPDLLRSQIKQVVPSGINALHAFIADEQIGKTFKQRLDENTNLNSEVAQVLKAMNHPFMEDEVIDEEELEKFKEAIVDPYSDFWKTTVTEEHDVPGVPGQTMILESTKHDKAAWEKATRSIVEDALYYGAVNQTNLKEENLLEPTS
jgi:hypothetical protein